MANKPIKTVKGNDPNLARAMANMAGQGETFSEGLEKARAGWMQSQLSKAAAHAERVLDADEEMPLSRHIIMLAICAFFIVFFLWASFASLEETTRGEGRVIPSKEVQKLSSLEGGIIDEVLVKEGEEVQAGQTVARLSEVAAGAELGSGEARYMGLKAAVARLQAEVEGRVGVAALRRQSVPANRLVSIRFNPVTLGVDPSEPECRVGIAKLGGKPKPPIQRGVIFKESFPNSSCLPDQ